MVYRYIEIEGEDMLVHTHPHTCAHCPRLSYAHDTRSANASAKTHNDTRRRSETDNSTYTQRRSIEERA